MGLTTKVGEIWNEIPRRKIIDTTWMQEELRIETGEDFEKGKISAVLCRFVRQGRARKGIVKGSYKKFKNYRPKKKTFFKPFGEEPIKPVLAKSILAKSAVERKEEPLALTESEPTIEILVDGKSILIAFQDLKYKIKIFQKLLDEEKQTVKDLVEHKKELEELYRQAQTKILELNTNKKNKAFKLSDLQNIVRGK